MPSIPKRLGQRQPAAGYAADRGKTITDKKGINLVNILSWILTDVPLLPRLQSINKTYLPRQSVL